jgi:hypothetical protein
MGGSYYKLDFSQSNDDGSAGVYAGIKFFFNSYAALDVNLNYLFTLNTGSDAKTVLVGFGLSFIL